MRPERGSRERLRDGNTHCHAHSRAAAGYLAASAGEMNTPPCPVASSCSQRRRMRCKCSSILMQHLMIEEHECIERLILRGRSHTLAGSQMREKRANFGAAHLAGMLPAPGAVSLV